MAILTEADGRPDDLKFDAVFVAAGYESRCRWVVEQTSIDSDRKYALTFGYLEVGDYQSNIDFFAGRDFIFRDGFATGLADELITSLAATQNSIPRILIDISSMSRKMIANLLLAVDQVRRTQAIEIVVAYAASQYSSDYHPGPIREAAPIRRELAGWSSRPELPLGAVFGLGCEPDLVLGALQTLEPDKVWAFAPNGFDEAFSEESAKANANIGDIFDVSISSYELDQPTITRGRFEALLNAVGDRFRLIAVPFGPKLFAWLTMSTIVFQDRTQIGVWTFSSGDKARPVERAPEGPIVWHRMHVSTQPS